MPLVRSSFGAGNVLSGIIETFGGSAFDEPTKNKINGAFGVTVLSTFEERPCAGGADHPVGELPRASGPGSNGDGDDPADSSEKGSHKGQLDDIKLGDATTAGKKGKKPKPGKPDKKPDDKEDEADKDDDHFTEAGEYSDDELLHGSPPDDAIRVRKGWCWKHIRTLAVFSAPNVFVKFNATIGTATVEIEVQAGGAMLTPNGDGSDLGGRKTSCPSHCLYEYVDGVATVQFEFKFKVGVAALGALQGIGIGNDVPAPGPQATVVFELTWPVVVYEFRHFPTRPVVAG